MKNQPDTLKHSPVDNSVAHTKGPWKHEIWDYSHAARPHKELNIIDGKHLIATVSWDEGKYNPYTIQDMEARANAALIASSPDLLAAAIAVVERWDTPLWKDVPATAEFIGELRKAIHKATGK